MILQLKGPYLFERRGVLIDAIRPHSANQDTEEADVSTGLIVIRHHRINLVNQRLNKCHRRIVFKPDQRPARATSGLVQPYLAVGHIKDRAALRTVHLGKDVVKVGSHSATVRLRGASGKAAQ